MIIKQIAIFIENKPGRLAEITDMIAQAKINIRALSIADSSNFGVLRIIVEDVNRAEQILKENKIMVKLADVISVEIKEDKPGGLAQILKVLAKNNIAVEYMYAFEYARDNAAYAIIRVAEKAENLKKIEGEKEILKAAEILKSTGYKGFNI